MFGHPGGRTIENNLDSPPGTIDLHGLYVKEGASCQLNPTPVRILTIAEAERRICPSASHHDVNNDCTVAIERVDAALDQAKRNDEDELRIIVGASCCCCAMQSHLVHTVYHHHCTELTLRRPRYVALQARAFIPRDT